MIVEMGNLKNLMMMMTPVMETLMVLMILMAELLGVNPIEIYFKSLDIPIAF